MDTKNAFGAEFRKVQDRTHDDQPVRVVAATRVYPTDPADLWNALTDAERLPRWFLPVSGQLELGGRYQLEGNASGTILRCDPSEALDVTWEYGGNLSWVQVRIAAGDRGARFTLEHLTPRDDTSEDHWRQYGPGAVGVGWDLALRGLALHLDCGGEPIDPNEIAVWMVSADGKEFVRTASRLWGEAHAQAGEDKGVAEAMANRTADFYTGA